MTMGPGHERTEVPPRGLVCACGLQGRGLQVQQVPPPHLVGIKTPAARFDTRQRAVYCEDTRPGKRVAPPPWQAYSKDHHDDQV